MEGKQSGLYNVNHVKINNKDFNIFGICSCVSHKNKKISFLWIIWQYQICLNHYLKRFKVYKIINVKNVKVNNFNYIERNTCYKRLNLTRMPSVLIIQLKRF